jgi:hypothetical protein
MTSGGDVAKEVADGGGAKPSRDSRDSQGAKVPAGGGGGGGTYSRENIALFLSASVERPVLSAAILADIDFVTAGQMEVRACL